MRNIWILFISLLCIWGCRSNESADGFEQQEHAQTDSMLLPVDTASGSINAVIPDSSLLKLNDAVLTSIKQEDWSALQNYIHPSWGLHLSPYANVNKSEDLIFPRGNFAKAMESPSKLNWGHYDGTGDPIRLSAKDYFKRFVYDVDFMSAERVTVNSSSAAGNIINNIESVFGHADYVENYFSGFDPDFQGMDWRALRLVFKREADGYYLIAIVHDQWTT